MSTITNVKNIVSAYNTCKYLRIEGRLHFCKKPECSILGEIGTDKRKLFDKILTKGELESRVNEFILI